MENYPSESATPLATTPIAAAKALPGVSALFKEAWNIYRQRWGVLLGIALVPSLLMYGIFYVNLSDSFNNWMVVLGIVGIVVIIAQIWSQVALLEAVQASEERIGIKESYSRGGRRIWSYLWICLILAFVLLGGYLLFIIPGIIMTVLFSLALFALVSENKKGMDALMRSRQLVKGNWWAVLGRIVCVSLVVIAVSALVDLIGVEGLGDLVTGVLISPFALIYMFLVYKYLRATKNTTQNPETESKTKFVVIGILGLLVIPALLILSFTLLEIASREVLKAGGENNIQGLPY